MKRVAKAMGQMDRLIKSELGEYRHIPDWEEKIQSAIKTNGDNFSD